MNRFFLQYKWLLLCVTSMIVFAQQLQAQVSLTASSATTAGSYTTLKDAFDAINLGTHQGNISIQLTASTTETASAVLQASGTGSAAYVTISVVPSGGGARVISGSVAGPIIDLSGADSVIIDGLNTGGNSLEISNTNTGGSALRFINDASGNTITNTTLKGAGNTTTLGVIVFSTGTTTGNDNNTISFCTIMDGATTPVNGIYCSGTTTAGIENSGNTISSCNIANYFSASVASMGINLSAGATNWTITGNRLYQTATRTYTTANTHKAIVISGSGNGYVVSNNIIGYSSSTATGTYTMAGTIATRFIGIEIAAGTTTASSLQGNTVTAISLATSSGAATANGILCGINILSGNVNVGTVSGNTIGAATGTAALSATPTTTQGAIVGICMASTGTVSIQNNTIGAFSSVGSTASIAAGVVGINATAAAASLTISGNTIGNATANNMVAGANGTTTGNSIASGINMSGTPTIAIITNNTIQNFASFGTGVSSYVRGIWTAASTGSAASITITSNTIANLTTNSASTSVTSGQAAAVGINFATGTNGLVSQNTIYGISLTNTGAIGSFAAGITHGNATSTTISRNRIYDISNASTSVSATAPGTASGIIIRSGTTAVNIHSNMISLGTGQTSNTVFAGIYANHGSTPDPIDSISNNTINITGTVTSGAQPSFCFTRGDFSTTARTATVNLRNNIFTNLRTGGTGKHYALSNHFGATTASATGWSATASNNNVLNAASTTIGYWTTDRDFTAWKSTSGGDGSSLSGVTVTYVNAANDLHLNMGVTATAMESGGLTIANKAIDFDGDPRPGPAGSVNGGATGFDIGADEFDGVFLDIVPPVINYTALTRTPSLGNRTLNNFATISDLSSINTTVGTKPRIYYKKKSDANDLTGWKYTEATNSSSPFSFVIDYTLLNGGTVSLSDTIQYFIVAQDMAPSPNVSVNSGTFSATPSSVALTNAAFPIGGTPNSYTFATTYSGVYTVGTSGTYATLKTFFDLLNAGAVSGNIDIKVVGDCAETATALLNPTLEEPLGSNFSISITPDGGAARTISGTLTSVPVIKTVGVSNFTINGLNTGGNSLTVTNLATTAPIGINITSAGTTNVVNDSILNVTVNTNLNTGTTLSSVGIAFSDQSSPLGSGYFNGVVIRGCTVTKAQYGIAVVGGAAAGTSNAVNVQVSENNLATSGANAIGYCGIVLQGVNNGTVKKNTVGGFEGTASLDDRGIWIAAGVKNTTTEQNFITGIKYTGTSGYGVYGVMVSSGETASNNVVKNNTIADLSGDGWNYTSVIADNVHGIFCSGTQTGIKIYNNSINLTGNTSNQTSALSTGICLATGSTADIRNNNIVNNLGLNTLGYGSTAIFLQTAASQLENINYNNYVSAATGTGLKLIGKIGTTDYATMAAWQAAVPDSNSISFNPLYTGLTNLIPASCKLNNKGTVIAGVTTDYLDSARSMTTPDIGAFEFTPTVPATPSATTSFSYCQNATATALAATGSNKLLWYTTPTGGMGDTLAPTPSTVTPGTTSYYVADSNESSGCVSSRLQITVTTNAPVASNTITSTPAAICSGNAPAALNASTPTGGSGIFTYKWIKSTVDSVSGFAVAGGNDSNQNYTPSALSATAWFKRIVSSGACGADTSASKVITVNPAVGNNTISSPQTICSGSTPTALTGSTPTGGTGVYTYTWISSTTSATTGYTAASGTNNTQGYTPSALTANTWYKRIVSSGACGADTSAAIQVTINTAVSNNTISSTQTICSGSTPTALTGSTPTGGTGVYTYIWLSSTTSATTGYAAASGTNNTQGYAPSALTANTWYKRIASSGACGSDTSAALQITINSAVSNNTISSPQTICSGSTPTALTGSTPTGGTGSYTYTWIRSTTSASSGFSAATGTNNTQGYAPASLTANTWYKRIVSSGACGADTSASLQITVNNAGTWTGATSNAWSNTANWSCPQLPLSSTNVIIPSGMPNMPVITDAQQANNITIQSGASLTLNNANAILSVYGSITNNGTFTNTSGKLNMAGTSAQVLIGGTYSDLQVNNANGVSLGGNVILNDSLILTNGILTLDNYTLTLGTNAFSGAGSATSYIKTNGTGNVIVQNVGTAGKTGNVQIPVGNSTYNPVVLSNTGTADAFTVWVTDSVTSTYTGSTPTGAKLTSNAVNRTWFINEGTAGGSNATVTLQWTGANELSGFNRTASYVSRYNGTTWNGNTASAATGSNPYTQVRTGITAFSPFGVGSSGTLPVELISFKGTRQERNAVLNWSTASEKNNQGFEIQRSADGKNWYTTAFVKGAGNASTVNHYSYTDRNALVSAPVLYYRLKQVDINGTFVYTNIVTIRMDAVIKPEVTVMPNPFNSKLSLDITLPAASNVTVVISDISGKTLGSQEQYCSEGINSLALTGIAQLSSGVYFVTIRTANETITHKVIKE